jgi:transmembrane sensor
MKASDHEDSVIKDQAAAWVLRDDRGLTPQEQDEFLQWLRSDPRCRLELSRQREHWRRLDLLGQWCPEYSPRPNRDLLAPRWRLKASRVWPLVGGAVALAAAAVVVLMWRVSSYSGVPTEAAASHEAIAAIETRSLSDGSVAALNRGAAVAVLFTPAERRVLLERGEAHFTVAKNPARPFIVSAGGVEVRAVGTAFNVRLGRQAVEVLVTEGKVDLESAPVGDRRERGTVVRLENGQRSVIPLTGPEAPQVASVSTTEIEQLLAWQPRLLDFTAAPLRTVVAEFNRRNAPVRLVIADPDLAEVEVSASLRSDNVEGFIRLLEIGFGVEVERSDDLIRLRR